MADCCENIVVDCLGPMTPVEIDGVYDQIQTSMNLGASVEVNCSGVAEASICFIQLLLSARKSAAQRGVGLRLQQPISAPLRDALERVGFIGTAESTRESEEFWLGGA